MSRIRAWAIAVLCLGLAGPVAADPPRFTTPDAASEVLEAKDLPFSLRYDPEQWRVGPQQSKFPLLARVVHRNGQVSGAFVYREQVESEADTRERAREELDNAFESYEIEEFGQRVVNDAPVLFMKADATTADGTEVAVRNYYWHGPEGVADYGVVANREALDEHREAMMDLLNGLEID